MRTVLSILLLSTLMLSCTDANKATDFEPMDYTLYFGENPAGFFKSARMSDGSFEYIFEYNDRGRGPHLEEIIRLNEEGYPESLQIQGHNYLKDTVNETFSLSGNEASWNSRSEQGTVEIDEQAFYVGVNSSFGNTELLVQQMLTSQKRTIDLYPTGTLTLNAVEEIRVGDTLDLKLVELVGFYFTPSYLWFDADNRFFAAPSSWLTTIRTGYESLSAELLEIQTAREKSYYASTAKDLTREPQGTVVISNVNIFDAERAEVVNNMHVLINGNRIESVLPTDQAIPENAYVIDGSGKTLLPGMFDMHTHMSRSQGILHLAAGVTSVRDLANSFDLPEIREEFDDNAVLGPRIVIMCGFIDQAGPYAGPTGKIINSLEEGLDAVDFYKERGYQQIKLYSSIDPAWVKPIATKAHEEGMRVSGHIPAYMIASQAVEDGYDEIQHINMIALNFMSDTIDTRTPLRFSMIGEHAHEIDANGEEFRSFMELLKTNGTVVDPTVGIFEGMLTSRAGEPDPQLEEVIDRLPIQVRRGYYSGGLPIPEGKELQYQESFDNLLKMIKALYDAGITIVPGTDAMPGFSYHKELEQYVSAGIPAKDVLQMATITSAMVTGRQDELGSIKEGKLADLILVDGNPAENISDIRRVELTIKDGKIYEPKQLYQAIGVGYFE